MALTFKKATKTEAKLRLALIGTSGSGKTFTALTFATALAPTGKIAVIDTERGSASKYADKFSFDALDLDTFAPAKYVEAIAAAQAAGYEVLVIDSLSHAWSGKDGALEMVDKAAKRSQSGNSFTAWRDVTPEHNRMIDAIVGANMHVIVTLRAKTEYVMEANAHGKLTPRKIGLAPVQRDGMEYEFDVVGTMNDENTLVISKTRCSDLSGGVYEKPNGKVTDALKTWLTGAKPEPKAAKVLTPLTALDEITRIIEAKDFVKTADRIRELFAYACAEIKARRMDCEGKPASMKEAAASTDIMLGRCIEYDRLENEAQHSDPEEPR